jgi:hypothetical protein
MGMQSSSKRESQGQARENRDVKLRSGRSQFSALAFALVGMRLAASQEIGGPFGPSLQPNLESSCVNAESHDRPSGSISATVINTPRRRMACCAPRSERPRRRAADKGDELAPF